MQISYTRPSQCPQLAALAQGCNNGACNVSGIVLSLADGVIELQAHERNSHPAVKIVVGHLSYLLGEGIGPSQAAQVEWVEWSSQDVPVKRVV